MRVSRDQTIAALPAVDLRDYLRRVDRFSTESFADDWRLEESQASGIIAELCERGFIEKDQWGVWRLTIAGNALRMATAAKPAKRETAQRHLDEVVRRADEVNRGEFAYWVTKLLLFGSFLTGDAADPVGDVDLGVELSPRGIDDKDQRVFDDAARARAAARGMQLDSLMWIAWPIEEVHRYLKQRSRVLSLVDVRDGVFRRAEVATKEVYRFTPPT